MLQWLFVHSTSAYRDEKKSRAQRICLGPLNLETAAGCCLQLWPGHWMDSASKATAQCLLLGVVMGTSTGFPSTEAAAEINTTLQPTKHATLCPANFLQVQFGLVFRFYFSCRFGDLFCFKISTRGETVADAIIWLSRELCCVLYSGLTFSSPSAVYWLNSLV